MKKQAMCLQLLNKIKNAKLRKAILEHADPELIHALCECAHNILRGNVQMTSREKARLRKYKTKLRLIARKDLSVTQKRRKPATDGWIPTGAVSPIGGHRHRTVATSTASLKKMLTKGTRGTGD